MVVAILFFLIQIVIAIATILVIGRLLVSIRRVGAKGATLGLLGAAIVTLLLLSARGLFDGSIALLSEGPPSLPSTDWLLAATGAVTLAVFAAYGRLLVQTLELEQSIGEMSASDSLTGTFNKAAFLSMAAPLVQTAQRFKHPLSALVVDIDHFAKINDDFGRSVGDEALRAFGGAVSACLRKIDLLGRLGGEKFAVILPHTDLKGATIVAERICRAVERNIKLTFDKQPVRLTASIGVATLHDGNLENLLNIADGVMYAAKRNGRNQVAVENAEPI
jgi:diguanylate cyclase (GGDEF)-like protein